MLNEIRKGAIVAADGSVNPARSDASGALIVVQGHGSLQEAVLHGNVYAIANQVGVTSQAGLSATTPVLTLANPAGSGKYGVIWYVGCSFTVIFAAVAAILVAVGTNTVAAAVTGTLTTAHRNLLLGTSNNNTLIPYLAATLPAAPVAIGTLGAGLTGAVNLDSTMKQLERWYNGALILKPGTNLSLQTIAASGASSMVCEYIWEEIPE